MTKRKGVSLVELLVALAILAMILLVIFNLFFRGTDVKASSDVEYELQSGMRHTADTLTERIRYSSAVFILPKSSFNTENIETGTYLTDYWDYFGVEKNKKTGKNEVVQYMYDEKKGRHNKTVLIESRKDLEIDMLFSESKKDEDDINKQIQYSITGYWEKSVQEEPFAEISSEAKALNSLHVRDYSTEFDPGTAIAFRAHNRDANVLGRVVLVLDNSGSMAHAIDSEENQNVTESEQRMTYVKEAANMMLDKFSANENIELSIVTFDYTADLNRELGYDWDEKVYVFAYNPYKDIPGADEAEYYFLDTAEYKTELRAFIESMIPYGLTNTGDGIRRAAYLFEDTPLPPNRQVEEFMILVIDGDVRNASLDMTIPVTYGEWTDPPYLRGRGNVFAYDIDDVERSWQRQSRYSYEEVSPGEWSLPIGFQGGKYITPENMHTVQRMGIAGIGNEMNVHAFDYLDEMGQKIRDRGVTSYIVSVAPEVTSDAIILTEEAVGIGRDDGRTFAATNKKDLDEHFNLIADEIINNLWYVMGPKLEP